MFAGWAAVTVPKSEAARVKADISVEAVKFVNYRSAAIRYLNATPAATEGVISAATLAPYATPGVAIPASGYGSYWRTTPGAVAPTLYVYTTTVADGRMIREVVRLMGDSQLAGTVSSGGTPLLVSPVNGMSTAQLPAIGLVPGALMAVGR